MLLARYFPDLRQDTEADIIRGMMNGVLDPITQQYATGVLRGAQMFEGLSLSRVRVFYGLAPDDSGGDGWRP